MGKESKSSCGTVFLTLFVIAVLAFLGYVYVSTLKKEQQRLSCYVCSSNNLNLPTLLNGEKARAVHYSTRSEASSGLPVGTEDCLNAPQTVKLCDIDEFCATTYQWAYSKYKVARFCGAGGRIGCTAPSVVRGLNETVCSCNEDQCRLKPTLPTFG